MSRPRAFGSASTLATSALICMTSARGVPAGANSPERLAVRQAGRRWSGGRVVGEQPGSARIGGGDHAPLAGGDMRDRDHRRPKQPMNAPAEQVGNRAVGRKGCVLHA
jgi:hypothetical protein